MEHSKNDEEIKSKNGKIINQEKKELNDGVNISKEKNKLNDITEKIFLKIVVIFCISSISIWMYYFELNKITSLLFILLGIGLFIYDYRKSNFLFNPVGVFEIVWFSTIGLSTLKLHSLQEEWSILTWFCLISTSICFNLGYSVNLNFLNKKNNNENENKITNKNINESIKSINKSINENNNENINIKNNECINENKIENASINEGKSVNKKENIKNEKLDFKKIDFSLNFLTIVVIIAFFIEVLIRRYIPLFSNKMNSYMNFSVTGLHYFTVSSSLILPLCVYIYINYKDKLNIKLKIKYLIYTLISIGIPILIVSRQLLMMTLILSFFTIFILKPEKTKKYIFIMIALICVSWIFLSMFRNQNDEYLKSVLKLKKDDNVKAMRTYMYVTFNYENLNYNINNLQKFTYGIHTFFPIFALTGLKFIFPVLTTSYLKYVIPVFNTFPFIMTYYEDFGIIGVIIFSFVIGMISKIIFERDNSPRNILYKVLMLYNIVFCFFANFFSSPSIWFYFICIFFADKFLWNENPKIHIKKDKIQS